MFHKPAHKNTKNPPGQTKEDKVLSVESWPELPKKSSKTFHQRKEERVLKDYIKRKQEAYGIPVSQRNQESVKTTIPERQLQPLNRAKKMTFEDWFDYESGYTENVKAVCKEAWKAAQENIETSAKPPVSREYTQAEIESWNAQGGAFTQEEKDNTGWK